MSELILTKMLQNFYNPQLSLGDIGANSVVKFSKIT